MKTAIIYASKYGTTEKIAHVIAEKLTAQNKLLFDLKKTQPDIKGFDTIILGTAIYGGMPMKEMTLFCKQNSAVLQEKPLYLFIGGMEPSPEKREVEIQKAFSDELRHHASGVYFLGGAFQFTKMNFIERFMIKRIAKTDKDIEKIEENSLNEMIKQIIP